jgi:hypothetical protein
LPDRSVSIDLLLLKVREYPEYQSLTMKLHQLFLLTITFSITALIPSQAQPSSMFGTWSTVSNVGTRVNPYNGQVLGTTGAAHHITLKANGSYEKTDFYQFADCRWFQHSGTYKIQNDRLLLNPKKYDWAICGEPSAKRPLTTQIYRWRFQQYNDGTKLELLSTTRTQDWGYAETLTRQE